jgi:N-acetylglutamate synthase-like GNAT family acetyltransferase
MSGSANIRDIHYLQQLKDSICRFCDEMDYRLISIKQKFDERYSYVQNKRNHFEFLVGKAKEQVNLAKAKLHKCESSFYVDEEGNKQEPNCSIEQQEVSRYEKALRIAEDYLHFYGLLMKKLDASIDDYAHEERQFKTFNNFIRSNATHSLGLLITGLEDYISLNILESGFPGRSSANSSEKMPNLNLGTSDSGIATIFQDSFLFVGKSGKKISLKNRQNNNVISSFFESNGQEFCCSEVNMDIMNGAKVGKILKVAIPDSLKGEKVAKHIVQNMEMNCRANDCAEVTGWVSTANQYFYMGLGYKARNQRDGVGSEMYKTLDSEYSEIQNKAKAEFENGRIGNSIFQHLGTLNINPLYILSPEDGLDDKFWRQHGNDQERYFELLEKFEQCSESLKSGITLDQIRKDDSTVANAYDIFHGSEKIQITKSGDYYKVEGNGRHRVAAAQLYYLKTGKIISLPADVTEKI